MENKLALAEDAIKGARKRGNSFARLGIFRYSALRHSLRALRLAQVLIVLFSSSLLAQQTIRLADRPPDCYVQFGPLTATGATFDYDNRASGCAEWTVTYSSSGFSALSIVTQSAPTNAGGTGAGAYVTFAGSITLGVNPNTAITQAETDWDAGYNPWVRVNLTSATGTGQIYGVLYGWRTVAPIKTSAVSTTNANVTQLGGNNVTACNSQAIFNLAAAGNTQIIAASGSTQIRICHIDWSTTAPEDFKLTYGTGANCVTGTTDLTGLSKSVQSWDLNYTPWSPLVAPASQAVCANPSTANALGGTVIYDQH